MEPPLVPDTMAVDGQIDISDIPVEGLTAKVSAVVTAILREDL